MQQYLIKVNWYTSHRVWATSFYVNTDNVLHMVDRKERVVIYFHKWSSIKSI